MKTFEMFLDENAAQKMKSMSDSQFADYKKANPGASSKADELRYGKSPVKPERKALPPADKGGAIVPRKPDVRKSQLGKWSQGVKSNPSSITKSKPSSLTKAKSPVEKVKVKVDPPQQKKPSPTQRTNKTYSSLKKPDAPKPQAQKPKKKRPDFGKLAKKGLGGAASVASGIGKRAIDQNKNARETDASSASNLDGAEIRMYGDERF